MILIKKISLLSTICLSWCFAATLKESSILIQELRSDAAQIDINFFTAFLEDFNDKFDMYTSVMNQYKLTLPQNVANYYYHLAPLPSTIDLQSDIAVNFPFAEFKSFITKFPWYSSLLSDGKVTDFYLPSDFISHTETLTNSDSKLGATTASVDLSSSLISSSSHQLSNSKNMHTTQPTSNKISSASSNIATSSDATTSSQNNGNGFKRLENLSLPLVSLVILFGLV